MKACLNGVWTVIRSAFRLTLFLWHRQNTISILSKYGHVIDYCRVVVRVNGFVFLVGVILLE